MSTPISDFYDPVRFLLGDHDDTFRLTQDSAIARGVRCLVKGGQIPGFSLTGDNLGLTPTLTLASDFMLVSAKVAKAYINSQPDRQSFGDRGHRESIGSFKDLVFDLNLMIYKIESGDGAMFRGWQSLHSWVEGMSGVRKQWTVFTRLDLQAPFNTVSVNGG
jgi:hypothetical protein